MNIRQYVILLLALATAIVLGGCGPIVAQNPYGTYSPVNAVAEGDESRLLLKGADVVAYFVTNKFQPGLAQFSSRHEGVSFRFASAEHKALFDRQIRRNTCPSSAAIAPTASPTAFPGVAMPIPGK